jgi:hypothetical protein
LMFQVATVSMGWRFKWGRRKNPPSSSSEAI